MADGKERLVKEIGNLYLSDKASDIKITVGDVILFAHSVILTARCPAFELVLKWIYTGTIELPDFDSDIEILRLAHIYELTDLKELDIEHLKFISTIDTMSRLLNEAIILDLTELTQYT
uniref:BTB domain-containing protein n=1 Tax=Panagrellus redivivus TaxID=6233 RepID=A0A7E4VJE7_PANRE